MKKINLILAVLAVVLVLCASIGAASAYFTTYADARGGYVIHMKYESEISEDVEGNVKSVKISNYPTGPNPVNGIYPIFVRARVFAGNDVNVAVKTDNTYWDGPTGDYYFYTIPLFTGESSDILTITVSPATNSTVRPGDPIDVLVTYESVPAVFTPAGAPDMQTSWANGEATHTIEIINNG